MIENNNYEYLENENTNEDDKNDEFVIDNAEKAMWGINKIKRI